MASRKVTFSPKIAFGDIRNIKDAIKNGIIDQRDIVISGLKEAPSLFIIDDNKNVKRLKSHIQTFESMEDANNYLNKLPDESFDGEPIAVMSADKKQFDLYIAKYIMDHYGLLPVNNSDSLKRFEDHINDMNNPHHVSFDQTGLEIMDSDDIKNIVDEVFN